MEARESTFEEVYPIWNEELWPGRVSKIESMSSLYWKQPREIIKDSSIFDKYTPSFFVIKEDNKIVGVNSGFRTDERIYRSRGLWVREEYRTKGYGKTLLMQAIIQITSSLIQLTLQTLGNAKRFRMWEIQLMP